ncbi:hypothetical protein PUND_a1739 [Pseudoalteromonas undina]|nr:hypothetical protein PUND_a1739 [Pseudoalteromonas undina]
MNRYKFTRHILWLIYLKDQFATYQFFFGGKSTQLKPAMSQLDTG